MQRQMQRYLVATLGFGFAATWTVAGASSALVCLLVAASCYLVTAAIQGRTARRVPANAPSRRQRPLAIQRPAPRGRSKAAPAQRQRSSARPPRVPAALPAPGFEEAASEPSVIEGYGW